MDQEVMNQLSEEVLRLDTRIDNVSNDLVKLDKKVDSLNNNAINQRVNDISNVVDNNTSAVNSLTNRVSALENNDELSQEISYVADDVKGLHDANDKINATIGDLSNIIDDHNSRINNLENQTKQTAEEVALRAARSVTRSIESSELDNIHDKIYVVANAVDNLDASIAPKVNSLMIDVNGIWNDIEDLNKMDASINKGMVEMDAEYHEELHRLAGIVDRHDSSINLINNKVNNYIDSTDIIIAELHAMDESINHGMVEMDKEHHEELHRIALAIDNHDSSISLLYNRTNNFIEDTNNHLERLDDEDASIWNAMEEMDVEHHEELHLLAQKIDAQDAKIAAQDEKIRIQNEKIDAQDASINLLEIHSAEQDANINQIIVHNNTQDASINQIITYNNVQDASINSNTNRIQTLEDNYVPHVVLTEKEYEDLKNPDASTFYFTYEDY